MSHLDLYTAYRAHCDLATRDIRAGEAWAGQHQPAAWLHILSVEQFTSLHLTRLAEGAPILQKIAAKNLEAYIRSHQSGGDLKSPPDSNTAHT